MQASAVCEGQLHHTVLPDAPWFMLALVVGDEASDASECLDACCAIACRRANERLPPSPASTRLVGGLPTEESAGSFREAVQTSP